MGDVLFKVLEMSLSGGIAILAVLLLRLVFQKFPKKLLILFWLVVAFRLVIPFNLSSPTSAKNITKLFSSKETSVVEEVDSESNVKELGSKATSDSVKEDHSLKRVINSDVTVKVAGKSTPTVAVKAVLASVWLSVAGGLFIFFMVRYFNFYSKARWCSRSYDGRYFMTEIESPFVIGFLSPKIFVPVCMDEDEREYILNHEWTHIKNKDGLTKLICYFILCIHWFNPLVWLAYVMLCADMEMRVDEETTSSFDMELIKEYCISIVHHATGTRKSTSFMQGTAFSGLGFGGMEAKLRVANLLKGKKINKALQVIILVFAMSFTFLVSTAAYDFNDDKASSDSSKASKVETTSEKTEEEVELPAVDEDESEESTGAKETYFSLNVANDCTWIEANAYAKDQGGVLASIDSQEEWETVTSLIKESDATDYIFYVGALRGTGGEMKWLSGEEIDSSYWLPGEPSGTGPTDDGRTVDEPYVAMFYRESDGRFYLMDVPDDMLDAASCYENHIGFICEIEK